MSVRIKYKGETIETVDGGQYAILHTNGAKMVDNVRVEYEAEAADPVLQEKSVTENGEYTPDAGYDGFSKVTVNVPTGGGTCSGKHVIPVDELPAVGEEGAIYSIQKFNAIAWCSSGSVKEDFLAEFDITANAYYTAQTLPETGEQFDVCYVESENEIYLYADAWTAIPTILNSGHETKGMVSDVAEITEDGYYAVCGRKLSTFTNGRYRPLLLKGELRYKSNEDGTCRVEGITAYGDQDLVIPSVSPNGDTVTSIRDYAFAECVSLTSVTIPDTVTSIGNQAFNDCCSLKSVTIPNSVTSIGSYAFGDCKSLLNDITIPNSVTSIGSNAFSGCGANTVRIQSNITSIPMWAFSSCFKLGNVSIPSTVTSIEKYAFYKCYSLSTLIIPASVTSIGQMAFCDCFSLEQITFGGTVEQWNAISLEGSWNSDVPATQVKCTDGTVTL